MKLAKLLLLFVVASGTIGLAVDRCHAFNNWCAVPAYYSTGYYSSWNVSPYMPYYGAYGYSAYSYGYRYGGCCCRPYYGW